MSKRGQYEGSNVAVIIAMIAVLLVGYLILIPPEEREKLLGEDEDNGDNGVVAKEHLLLSETPGMMYTFESESVKHKLAPIDLYLRTKPDVSSLANSILVSRSLFSNNVKDLRFNLDDTNLEGVSLFFVVKEAKGRLIISLNNQEIYNSFIDENQLISIELPTEILQKSNLLTFMTSFSLVGSNQYVLQDVKIRKEFNIKNVEESRSFVLSDSELDNFERARLNMFVSCNSLIEEQATLSITVNDKIIKREDMACVGGEMGFDIDKDYLDSGRNTLKLAIDKGDFRFSDLEVEIELSQKVFPTYRFSVDEDDFNDVKDGRVDAILKMDFLDKKKRKNAQLFLNGEKLILDTNSDVYTKDVSKYLIEDENELKIVPLTSFEIVHLEIRLK